MFPTANTGKMKALDTSRVKFLFLRIFGAMGTTSKSDEWLCLLKKFLAKLEIYLFLSSSVQP